jgi:hypothetical protein
MFFAVVDVKSPLRSKSGSCGEEIAQAYENAWLRQLSWNLPAIQRKVLA